MQDMHDVVEYVGTSANRLFTMMFVDISPDRHIDLSSLVSSLVTIINTSTTVRKRYTYGAEKRLAKNGSILWGSSV